ncbi:MAG: hypothetical protein KC518_13855, partial [Candidatus Cloacimonetes bacterium]|nr:hypothetical protein [Candidatus Cloacimonadota bacterium]
KVLVYETAPQTADPGMEWLDRAALAVGYDALSMRQLSQSIIDDMISDGMDPAGIATRYGGTSDSQGSWVSGQFGSGIGLYNYRGWIGMNGVSASFVDNNSNFLNAYRTPVAAVFTCSTGDFNGGYSTTEALLVKGSVAEPRGAVASMGLATSLTHTAYNNVLVGGFWSAVLDHGLDQIGPAMFFGKQTLVMNMPNGDASADAFSRRANLMGDPGMDIWVGIPEILSVQLAAGGTTIPLGSGVQDFLVLSNGTPAEGIAVCLYQSGNVFQRGTTDASGHVLLDASGASAGALKLTASRSRHLPDRQTLTVVSQNNFAGVTTLGVTGDGLAAPGESVSFLPTVSNPGATAIAGLSCTLSMDPAYGTVSDNSSAWPTIAAGGTAGASNALQVTLAGDLADGTQVPLTFQFNSTTLTSWTETEFLTVNAPRLEASSLTFSPGGTLLQPGTTASLSLTLGNLGTLDASSLNLSLASAGDPFVSVTSGVFNGFSANAGGSGVATFQLSADLHSLRGHQASLPLTWSGGGLSGQTMVSVTVGSSGSASPTGPDAWGYRAIENTDFHSLAPEYQWIEIATPAGGNGTFINLGDTGNELDAAQLVTLPFAFTYYGQSYTQMAVCSNGFAAFGENAHVETDYRNHYLPTGLGPDNMLAVMWDDMLLGSGAAVYSQYFPAEHKYVVEWYNMRFNNDNGARNTFQLILFDPAFHPTATGDGEFVYQYLDFINTQSHSYDFPYCTIGIKNGNSTDGLTVSNFNLHPASIAGINDAKALKFTTDLGSYSDEDLAPPVIIHVPPAVSYSGQPIPISASITDNHGVANATIHWDAGNGFSGESMGNLSGDTWSGFIPAQLSGSVIHYYLTATDVSDNANVATSPTWTLNVYDIIFEEPFEGTSSFSHEAFGGGGDEWHLESARSHAGSSSMKFGGAGTADYSASGAGWLTSSPIAIPAGASNLQLSFWSWIDGETSGLYPDSCYDGGVVEFSLDGGLWQDAVLTPAYTHALRERSVVPLDFPRLMISGSADWTQYALDVPDGVGQVQLRFGFVSDTGTNREGWYVDEVRLSGQLPPTLDGVTDLHIVYGANTAVLSWSPVPDAIGYRIYSGTDPWAITGPFVAQVVDPFWVDAVGGTPRKFYLVTAIR